VGLLRRFQALTEAYPGLLELTGAKVDEGKIAKHSEQNVEFFDLKPYYRGVKNRNVAHKNAKRAFMDTYAESGCGAWIQAPIHVDLFLVKP